jgi:hypothetical protein
MVFRGLLLSFVVNVYYDTTYQVDIINMNDVTKT